MARQQAFARAILFTSMMVAVAGCSELRGRRHIREGNRLYRDGQYAAALQEYRQAEPLAGALPLLWLNEGLTCRQLMIPGGKSAKDQQAADCALVAFERLKQLAPNDARAEQLYVQTLFDAERYDVLATRFRAQLQTDPADVAAVNGLIQASSRSNQPEQALAWYQRKATLLSNDAEAQYAVGVFIWQQLFQRGGGPDKASFDPRSNSISPERVPPVKRISAKRGTKPPRIGSAAISARPPVKAPPPFAVGDITGNQRVTLADLGIKYLERALALRPNYHDALVYLNLLYRQKAMAYFDRPELWQQTVDSAEKWRRLAATSVAPASTGRTSAAGTR